MPLHSIRVVGSPADGKAVGKLFARQVWHLRSAHLTRVFSEFPSSHQYDCVDGMRQRNDVCRNAKRGLSIPATRGYRT